MILCYIYLIYNIILQYNSFNPASLNCRTNNFPIEAFSWIVLDVAIPRAQTPLAIRKKMKLSKKLSLLIKVSALCESLSLLLTKSCGIFRLYTYIEDIFRIWTYLKPIMELITKLTNVQAYQQFDRVGNQKSSTKQ